MNALLVLDPAFDEFVAECLRSFLPLAPVWIVDTDINKASIERLRNSCENLNIEDYNITLFKVFDSIDALRSLVDVIPAMEIHFGQANGHQLVFPHGFAIRIIGINPTKEAIDAMQDYDFTSFIESVNGFEAQKD